MLKSPRSDIVRVMDLDSLLAAMGAERRVVPAGSLVVRQGDQAAEAYRIVKGRAAVFRALGGGEEALVAHLGPGDILGEMALLRYDAYTLSVRADTELDLYVISASMLHDQLRQTPPLVRALLDLLIDRIYETNETLIDIESLKP